MQNSVAKHQCAYSLSRLGAWSRLNGSRVLRPRTTKMPPKKCLLSPGVAGGLGLAGRIGASRLVPLASRAGLVHRKSPPRKGHRLGSCTRRCDSFALGNGNHHHHGILAWMKRQSDILAPIGSSATAQRRALRQASPRDDLQSRPHRQQPSTFPFLPLFPSSTMDARPEDCEAAIAS